MFFWIIFFSVVLLRKGYSQNVEQSVSTPQTGAKLSGYDGTVIFGYVDEGAFLNFTGPNANISFRKHKIIVGMLPSLRFKQDNSEIKNAPVTPNLGVGITYCYKRFALQVPLYYNPKTGTKNGNWNLGIGAGIRIK